MNTDKEKPDIEDKALEALRLLEVHTTICINEDEQNAFIQGYNIGYKERDERIKQLEEEHKIWDKSSLVELVKTNELLEEENRKLREALKEIITPIPYMQQRLKEGESLNGGIAVMLANDPTHLRNIAQKVLNP